MSQKTNYLELKEEIYSYFYDCRNLLKLISLKDSIRGLFKQFACLNLSDSAPIPQHILNDLSQSLYELGAPFATFSDAIHLPEFKNWFLDLRSFLFNPSTPSQDIITYVTPLIYQIIQSPLFKGKPPREDQIKLFLSSSQLLTKLKLDYQPIIPNTDMYESFIINKVDEFFEPLDWVLLKTIVFYLKISVSGYYHSIKEKKSTSESTKMVTLGYSEVLLREIRNFAAHPEGYSDTWESIFTKIEKKRGSPPLDKVIFSPLGKVIFQNTHDPVAIYSNRTVKSTLDYCCLTNIVLFVEDWLEELDKEVSKLLY